MANGRSICSALLAALLIFGAWAWYARAAEPELFGPVDCSACSLETPNPGVATKTFLEAWAWDVRHTYWPPNQMYVNVNDKIMVCNGKMCVTYTLTDSGQYFGGKAEQQTSNPNKGGRSGSGKSGGRYDGSSADGRDRKGGNARENERDGKDYTGRVTVGKWTRK